MTARAGTTPWNKGARTPIVERAMRHVAVDENGCWIWTGSKFAEGYARIRVERGGRTVTVHKLLWEATNGPTPLGMELGHRCPAGARKDCVNPAHIDAITHAENQDDFYGGLCARRLHRMDEHSITFPGGGRKCKPCRDAQRLGLVDDIRPRRHRAAA